MLEDLSRRGVRLAAADRKLSVSAPAGVLDGPTTELIRARREEILQFLRERAEEEARRAVRIERADRSRPLPASYAQQRLWLIEQLATDLPVYNMYFATTLTGELDEEALRWAADRLTERHEALRTALRESPEGLRQVILPDLRADFRRHDLTGAPAEALDPLMDEITRTRFDLAVAPLVRFDLVHCAERRWILVVTQHHVISDGWSTGVIRRELSELYAARVQGRPAELPELAVQYADYAVWERSWLGSELARRQKAFWRGQLADLPPLVETSQGQQREAVQSYRGEGLDFRLSERTLGLVRELCERSAATPYVVFMAAYSLLLSRMARGTDIAIGSPLASRPYTALEQTLGLFFNSITVRTVIDERESVLDYLARVRRSAFDAFANQDLPFDQVVQEVAPERSSAHAPIFQSIFIYQSYPDAELELPGITTGPAPEPVYSAQYDLMLKLRQEEDGYLGQLIHATALFSAQDARRLVRWFERLVTAMAERPDRPVGELSLLGPEDEPTRREELPSAPPPGDDWRPVPERIAARLTEGGREPLLGFRDLRRTGAELADRAEAVAAGLRAAGLRPGDRVGLLVGRSPDLVAALLGVWRAGLAYVPLNGRDPQARLTAMLADAGCTALLTGPEYAAHCPGFTGHRLELDRLPAAPAAPVPAHRPAPGETAYLIFTSGSTGRPKGVEISHGNLASLFDALDRAVPLPERAHWLAVTAVTFDIAVVELLWTLARGVPVVLAENAETLATADPAGPLTVPELLTASGADALQATPTLLRTVLRLADGPAALARLRLLLVGGEPLDRELAVRLKGLGIPRVLNVYGPTETTVWSTAWEVPAEPERILVGRPLANTGAVVVDHALRPLPTGMFGELVLTGHGVAPGYAGAPELTAQRFVTLPGGARGYRTGDLARRLPGGDLELVGRLDNQVKVNGYRIELEEIERTLLALPAVAAGAAAVRRPGGRAVLTAYYVPADPTAAPDPQELRAALAAELPDPYVPTAWVELPALPTTTGGKVDRRALPDPPEPSAAPSAAPADEVQAGLLACWQQVLGRPDLGVDDDFFQSGGSSLLVAALLAAVRERVAPQSRIVDLFRHPTVRGFAAHLSGAPAAATQAAAPAATAPAEVSDARRRRREQVRRKRLAEGAGPAAP
ncbi:non-ribosomal peptide synthetase [Streptomyces sp. TLI_053]|uniref:non-ribosomal peptide synthetase n=1 Tax=Streptomyces sp. TLI_053 TaxID=1855352 RepID=UPI0013520CCC|nr:non-ribosomal peptide synthetase [Streptomyces sp. TLI_053]